MTPDAIIECVPNFSEGTDATKVRKIVAEMQVEGVSLLDWSLDTAHNRSVVTIAGPPASVIAAAVKSVGNGTAGEVTTDFNGGGYEVTVTKPGGSKVEVHLDGSFKVMQGPRGGHSPDGGPGGPPAGGPGGGG